MLSVCPQGVGVQSKLGDTYSRSITLHIYKYANYFNTLKRCWSDIRVFCSRSRVFCSRSRVFCPRSRVFCSRPRVFCSRPRVLCSRSRVLCSRSRVFCSRPRVLCSRSRVLCSRPKMSPEHCNATTPPPSVMSLLTPPVGACPDTRSSIQLRPVCCSRGRRALTLQRAEIIMGNAQDKPSGTGGAKTDQATPGFRRRSRAGSTEKPRAGKGPPEKGSVANGATQGDRNQIKDIPPDTSYLDAPAGTLPPHLGRLKNEGNHLFKNGQFADAVEKYSAAMDGCCDAGIESGEDLCILYSNRAACYLKDGNNMECIQDCTRALELKPFSLKPLLRRATAYESMERYRQAYVDFKTVLQIDIGVQAAHDSVHRITKQLIEQDGPDWRQKLPEIPLVPLSAQQHHRQKDPSAELVQAREAKKAEARFASLKTEGNDHVRKSQFRDGIEKYSECLKIKPDECSCFTNRAICYLRLGCFEEARQDCDSALKLEPTNKKAFYRRALAFKGLQDYLSSSSDLQEVLQLDPNVQEAEQELETVTGLLRQSLLDGAQHTPRV